MTTSMALLNPLWEPFSRNEFLRNALLGSTLVAIICAIAGTYVVLRGLSFIGDALAHGVIPGIAIALLFGLPGVVGAALGALVMMGGVSLVTSRVRLSSDTAIGLLFVGMLSLGVIITSRSTSFVGDITRILFGELLGVSSTDLAWQVVVLAVVAAIAVVAHRPFVLMSLDDGLARTSGFSVRFFHSLMLTMVAVAVVGSFQLVGTLLVLGLLIAPAATGALLTRRVSTMMLTAAGFGVLSSYLGLLTSYHFDVAAGASIVFTSVYLFVLVAILTIPRRLRGHRELPHQHEHTH
ncbi:MAG: iron chelate uptake ABC transporter family permease subunit [Ilumatobacteraceae bacterium]